MFHPTSLGRLARLLPVSASLLVLAACGGSSSPSSGPSGPFTASGTSPTTSDAFTTSDAGTLAYVSAFNETEASRIRGTAEFKVQDRSVLLDGQRLDVFSLASIRAEYAFSAGLTGAGETIAIVDSGFRPTHQEFAGKTVTVFGAISETDHGTGVAAIAAAAWDGIGMMGVAPGADLHLSSYRTGYTGLAAATRDALARGAVVQNNSWGYVDGSGNPITIQAVQSYLAANPGASVEKALSATVGGSTSDARTYLDALRAFTQSGVVVFAAPNENDATSVSVMDGLPLVAPDLAPGWLVAVNAVPRFSGDEIVSATRLSSGCLEMAHSCLAAEGVVWTARATSDAAYGLSAGTSFAAPQIAGGLALLAEAFPSLPASDLRRRLLASADNGFYTHTGTTDFGNGITHGFGEEYGHGFMNLKAALLPIGSVGVPKTNSAYGGVSPLEETLVVSGSPQGDAVARALGDETVVLFDGLGADFEVGASALSAGRADDFAGRVKRFAADVSAGGPGAVSSFALTGGEATSAPGWSLLAGDAVGVLDGLGLVAATSAVPSGPGSMAGLAEDATSLALQRTWKDGRAFAVYGFSSEMSALGDGPSSIDPESGATGAGLVVTRPIGSSRLSFGGSFMSETGGMLGLSETGRAGDLTGFSAAFEVGYSIPLAGEGSRLSLSAEIGTGRGDGGSLVQEADGAVFSGFGLALENDDVFADGDRLTLFARQPLRIEAGSATLRVPGGRAQDGTVEWRSIDIDLTPSSRQIDIGWEYRGDLGAWTEFRLGAALSHDEGHIDGNLGASVMGALRTRF